MNWFKENILLLLPIKKVIFMISFISSFEIINIVVCEVKSKGRPDPNIFLWIAASVADAAAVVDRNGIKTLLGNGFSTFPINGNPVFSNGRKSLTKNLPDCPILCNWVFDSFIWVDEPIPIALRSFESCVLVNNNLCRNLFWSLEFPTSFD